MNKNLANNLVAISLGISLGIVHINFIKNPIEFLIVFLPVLIINAFRK